MCGIIGITSKEYVAEDILDGLTRLEYRGYDSAGLAILHSEYFMRCRAKGKLRNLKNEWNKDPIDGYIGIGHTRWATHGAANEVNAHPHMNEKIAVVHNGIIENYIALKEELPDKFKEKFESETDSEVLVHLSSYYLEQGLTPKEVMNKLVPKLQGAFAFVMIFIDQPDSIFGARIGSPLAIGIGRNGYYFGSDAISLSHLTQKIIYLEDHDWAMCSQDHHSIYNSDFKEIERPISNSKMGNIIIGKGNYQHFMLKEIHEQPASIGDTLQSFLTHEKNNITLNTRNIDYKNIERISITACGTAYYSGCVAKYWLESISKINVDIDIASEFRYRDPVFTKNMLGLVISQSGETMDTLEAMKIMKAAKIPLIAISNVEESSIARKADDVLLTKAGPEIGVASTKAFTTQIVALALLAVHIGKARNILSSQEERDYIQQLIHVPSLLNQTLDNCEQAIELAHFLENKKKYYLFRSRYLLSFSFGRSA